LVNGNSVVAHFFWATQYFTGYHCKPHISQLLNNTMRAPAPCVGWQHKSTIHITSHFMLTR